MSWVPGFTAPPPTWVGYPGWAPHASGIRTPCSICMHMHKYTHLHAHIYICMHCVCIKAYACMACMHLHMHAWHACIVACLIPPMCTSTLHPTGEGGRPCVRHLRGGSHGHLHGPPHIPQGGGASPGEPLPVGGEGGGTVGTQDIYIYIYVYIKRERGK